MKMDEHQLKLQIANDVRERIFKIPRKYREYELLYQPAIQVNQSPQETKVSIKFTLGYKENVFPCKLKVEADCLYAKVGSVGAYFNNLKLKGKPDLMIAEFARWLKLARNGTKDGRYAILAFREKPVGFLVHPVDNAYSYAFMAREIAGSGLKPRAILSKYQANAYQGEKIDCWYEEGKFFPKQFYGKGLKMVSDLDLETRQTLLWSFLCYLALMK